MRRGTLVHGVLLLVALVLAYTTWQRDPTVKPQAGTVELWAGSPADVKSIQYEAQNKSVTLERRGQGNDAYYWGKVVRSTPPPKKPQKPDAGPDEALMSPAEAEPEEKPTVTTREFPVGEGGTKLLEKLAPLRVIRDLGTLDDAKKADYGLTDSKSKLIVTYAGGPRELVIGQTVYGGSDRYAMEPKSGKAYVLPGDIVTPLEGAESSLRESKLHAYASDDVAKATLAAADKSRQLVRKPGAAAPPSPDPHAPKPGAPATWADASAPDKADQTLANFMERVEKLSVMEYTTDDKTEGLQPILHIDYQGKDGKKLGELDMYRKPGGPNGEIEYFLKSERTRVLAKVHKLTAERVDQDLAQLLGLPPPPVSPPPPAPTPATPTPAPPGTAPGTPGAPGAPGTPAAPGTPGSMRPSPHRPGVPPPPPPAPGKTAPTPAPKPAPAPVSPKPATPPTK
jgi:hypothetical protein